MEKIVTDSSASLFMWQLFMLLFTVAIGYALFVLYKRYILKK